MRSLLLGILFIIILGFGGFVYRNAVEHSSQPIACPTSELSCPDGTRVSHIGNSCDFPACPPPNVSIPEFSISFALPAGFTEWENNPFPADNVRVYVNETSATFSTTPNSRLNIGRYPISASSTALATIQQTAIGGPSGLPIGATQFTSTLLGNHRFTVVSVERFEGVVNTAYYLARGTDVLRFDAIDKEVMNWSDSNLDVLTLPAHAALSKLLTTLQGQ